MKNIEKMVQDAVNKLKDIPPRGYRLRECYDCGKDWPDTGDFQCPHCDSGNTGIVTEEATQPSLPLPGQRWVTVVKHGTITLGTRFLIVGKREDGRLVCWKGGNRPLKDGTILREEHIEDE